MSFYTNILHYYDRLFPLSDAKLNFVREGISQKQNILDIGCATGSLCHELHHDGHQVFGIDIDKAVIEMAKGKAPSGPHFEVLDMLTIDRHFEDSFFDQVLCLDNTLAHLPNEMAVRRFFMGVSRILKPGGCLKIEVVNYDQAMVQGMLNLPPVEVDGILLKRHQCLEQQCMECYTELSIDGEESSYANCVPLFPIRLVQIETLLAEAGFSTPKVYMDFNRSPVDGNHIYNVLEATKES